MTFYEKLTTMPQKEFAIFLSERLGCEGCDNIFEGMATCSQYPGCVEAISAYLSAEYPCNFWENLGAGT